MNTCCYYTIGLVLISAMMACNSRSKDTVLPDETSAIPVTVQPLTAKGAVRTVSATGTFTTDDETVLAFRSGGIVQQIRVKEGESFRKGQLLAAVEAAESNAVLRQTRLGLEKAERDYHRARQLYADSVATLEQMQNAETAFDAAKQDVARAAYHADHTVITAPFDGYVLQRSANTGQVVGPGTPVLLVAGSGESGWFLKVGVSDQQWSAIQLGDSATVSTGVAHGVDLRAKVVRKSDGVNPQSGLFDVYLQLPENPGASLASGLFGKATIHLSERSDAWFIPYDALMDGDGGTAYVFVTTDGHTARRVAVEVSDITASHAVVTAGLEDGGSLIVSGSPYLRDGSTITVQ